MSLHAAVQVADFQTLMLAVHYHGITLTWEHSMLMYL